MWRRAGLSGDPLDEPHAYVDRFGQAHLTFETGMRWARAFAAAEPERVLDWTAEAKHKYIEIADIMGPVYSLMRDWTAAPPPNETSGEVHRLRQSRHTRE
jgi:hypothetical protein